MSLGLTRAAHVTSCLGGRFLRHLICASSQEFYPLEWFSTLSSPLEAKPESLLPHPARVDSLAKALSGPFSRASSTVIHGRASLLTGVLEGSSGDEQAHALVPAPQTGEGEAIYGLEIITGDFRGAGTDEEVSVRLIGERGTSPEVVLQGGEQDDIPWEFKRGSRRVFTITTADVGEVKRLQVGLRRRARDSVRSNSWFLDRVRVVGPSGRLTLFTYGDWLGESEDGDLSGSSHCDLAPMESIIAEQAKAREHPLAVACGAFVIPNPDSWTVERRGSKGVTRKRFGYGGEDAYFCEGPNQHGCVGLGVSDGVYMWRLQGIDAGEFSKQLMQLCAESVRSGETNALQVLKAAHLRMRQDRVKGSATVCLAVIDTTTGLLNCANLGDSGFLIMRRDPSTLEWSMVYKSPQQEHHFGCPYQLGHQSTANYPEDAMVLARVLAPGDLVVLGTDGLFDNLHDHEIIEAVEETWQDLGASQRSSTAGARTVAQALANRAFFCSLDKRKDTPYSQGATEEFDMVYSGGKADDITVVAAVIS